MTVPTPILPAKTLPATIPTATDPRALSDCEARRLISDLFHAMSQPLTALRCSLELALQQPPTAEQYREKVSGALAQAERVSWLAMGIRELFDAGQAGDGCEVLPLQVALENAIDEVLLVAESAGMQICFLPRSACPVWFEAQRLRRGLFHLLESMVDCGGRESVLRIDLAESKGQSLLALAVSGAGPAHDEPSSSSTAEEDRLQDLARRLGAGIARAIFEAAGGTFKAEHRPEAMSVEIRLPGVGAR
jgi:C4-dicarboxylate-specific signal transduction histidine kinase